MQKYTWLLFVMLILFSVGCTPSKVVLDCWEYDCRNVTIHQRPINCNEWYIHLPVEDLKCDLTAKGVKNINYITDPGNYINAPFTNLTYKVESLRTDKSFNGMAKFLPVGEKIGEQSIDMYYFWDIAFLPDGTFLVTQKNGNLYHFHDNKMQKIGSIETFDSGLTGLLGLAIDPDYDANHHIYVYYAYERMGNFLGEEDVYIKHRVSRLMYRNGKLSNEKILIDPIYGAGHSGGRINFGPDGNLYIGTGDADNDEIAMDSGYLSGKILRINKDGTIPKDNPFPGSPIYSLGHRNVQGLSWDPATNDLFNTEHGKNRFDEINRVEKGKNYGWGSKQCSTVYNSSRLIDDLYDPVFCFKEWTGAPSGMTFVNDKKSPLYGDLFVGFLRGKQMHRFVFKDGQVVGHEIFYINRLNQEHSNLDRAVRDVEYNNGSIFFVTPKGIGKIILG